MQTKFGERLKELRLERGIGQETLANAINLGHSTISMWENGLRQPTLPYLILVAKFFDVTLDYLAGLTEY